jgi:enoyl-CoA hydratase
VPQVELDAVKLTYGNGVAFVTIDRPPVNALNLAVLSEMSRVLRDLETRTEPMVVVVTGEGQKAFVAGADIGEIHGLTLETGKDLSRKGHEVYGDISAFPWPVIAGISGLCLGGGMELALACDIRIADDNARFGQPEVNLGIIPGWGGTQRLPRLVGTGVARELILTGRIITADEALRIGLVNQVVPREALRNTCMELAKTILGKAPLAVKMAKRAINVGITMSLEEGLKLEEECFGKLCASEDMKEGTSAFLEKRKAEFTGK